MKECAHIIAYANEADAHPCPVCERDALRIRTQEHDACIAGLINQHDKDMLALEAQRRSDFAAAQSDLAKMADALGDNEDIARRLTLPVNHQDHLTPQDAANRLRFKARAALQAAKE